MENRFTTKSSAVAEAAKAPAQGLTLTELTDAELRAVSGGLNPQPLPPREEPHFI